jgi:hypothetical protein
MITSLNNAKAGSHNPLKNVATVTMPCGGHRETLRLCSMQIVFKIFKIPRFQTIGRLFPATRACSQRVGPLASAASAISYVVHLWVRENRSDWNSVPVHGQGELKLYPKNLCSLCPSVAKKL